MANIRLIDLISRRLSLGWLASNHPLCTSATRRHCAGTLLMELLSIHGLLSCKLCGCSVHPCQLRGVGETGGLRIYCSRSLKSHLLYIVFQLSNLPGVEQFDFVIHEFNLNTTIILAYAADAVVLRLAHQHILTASMCSLTT